MRAADLFDPPPPVDSVPAPRAISRPEPTDTTPCPWRIEGKRCDKPVPGLDPMRTCARCRTSGAPSYVPWSVAKPATSATELPELVLVLANAHLSETAVKVSPKAEVGSFSMPDLGTFPGCGHPRRSPHGFCGTCNPTRL